MNKRNKIWIPAILTCAYAMAAGAMFFILSLIYGMIGLIISTLICAVISAVSTKYVAKPHLVSIAAAILMWYVGIKNEAWTWDIIFIMIFTYGIVICIDYSNIGKRAEA